MEKEIAKYLKNKKLNFRETGNNQFVFKICPFCDDNKGTHFYMNKHNGSYHCFKCETKGGYNTFRKHHGDPTIQMDADALNLKIPAKVYKALDQSMVNLYEGKLYGLMRTHFEYLKNDTHGRGLSKDTIKHFRLGSTGNKIAIPVFKNGELVNFRYRRDPAEDENDIGAKYVAEPYCKPELFNGDIIENEKPEELFLVEGEFDAMMLWDKGIKNVISTTLGADGFPEEWVTRLRDIKKINIIYDNDKDGKSGASKVATKLGVERCFNIELPEVQGRKKTDVSDYFLTDGGNVKDFMTVISNAQQFKEEDIIHIGDIADELRTRIIQGETFGAMTGYEQLDEILGGFRDGRIIVLSGLTSAGKSSLANSIGLNFADRGDAVFFYSLEMPPIDLAKRLLTLRGKIGLEDLKNIKDPSPELQKVDGVITEFKSNKLPIYMFSKGGEIELELLKEVSKKAVNKYHCKFIIIDHLNYFANKGYNQEAETAKAVREIKQLSLYLEVPILLLAHLNRGGRSQQKKGLYIPNLSDLRSSGAVEQDADQVLFICRDSETTNPKERAKTILKIAKNRDGQAGRSVSMTFNEDITYFEEAQGMDYEEEFKKKKKKLESEVEQEKIEI